MENTQLNRVTYCHRRDSGEEVNDCDESAEKSSNRMRFSSENVEDRRSGVSQSISRYVEAETLNNQDGPSRKRQRTRSPPISDNDENPSHKRSRYYHEETANLDDQQEQSVDSSKGRGDSPSLSPVTKESRRSRSPRRSSHKKKKHKRSRSRERHHTYESSKQSDSHRSKHRDYKDSTSRKRSRSPREDDIIQQRVYKDSSSRKRSRSPREDDRRDDSINYSNTPSSSTSFKIPKKKRREEDEPEERKPKISVALLGEIRSLLKTEHHHVERRTDDAHGDATDVLWCYAYLDPKIRGHITGGRAHLHHFCRVCKRTCLHLLGTYGTGQRKCLACASDEYGWREEEVPSWYFHETCKFCENDPKRRSGGFRGGYRSSWSRGGGGYRSFSNSNSRYGRY